MEMFMRVVRKFWHRLSWVMPFIFLGIGVLQLFQVTNSYSLIWLKRIWRTQTQTAIERSASFYLGDSGSKFMLFLDEIIPINKDVVLAERSAQFSHQGILQYFLFPRAIITCRCDELGGLCISCLEESDRYVPVTSQFPPPDFPIDQLEELKQFVPAPIESDYYLGVYIPLPTPEGDKTQTLEHQPFNLLGTLATDLAIWVGLGLLGIAVVHLILPNLSLIEAIVLAIPIGVGLQTWTMFISSWVGFPLTQVSIVVIYLVLGLSTVLFLKITKTDLHFEPLGIHKVDFKPLILISWIVIGIAWMILVIISVGRSYSLFDDIVIWSLKGHGIAYSGTIFAERLGGHGLSYPLNLPLSVTIFKLLDGDLLPGSKFLFPIALLALLIGAYRFCRRHGASPLLSSGGILLILSTPAIYFYATTGFANIPFVSYLILGLLWSYEGLEKDNRRHLILGGLLLAMAGWTRPEGFPYALALMAILLIARWLTRQSWRFSILWVLPLGIFPGIWLVFAHKYVADDQAGGALRGFWQQISTGQVNLTPLKTMYTFVFNQLTQGEDWRYFLPLALFLILAALLRHVMRPEKLIPVLLLVTLVAFGFIVGIFFIESTDEQNFDQFLRVSLDRALFPGIILMILSGVMAFRDESQGIYECDSPGVQKIQ